MTYWARRASIFLMIASSISFSLSAQEVAPKDSRLQRAPNESATFVGTDTCVDCHRKQVEAWRGSHHDMAMRHASSQSIRGDFNDNEFIHQGKPNRFYQSGDEYWVNIQGPDGQWHDYKISYTFGWEPLQQYMVEFNDGRVQLIPFAWDSRKKEKGGQRWFHLYPDTTPTDEFYWTNTGQNWNFMCADCHSTNLSKKYNAENDTYQTSWSEINVGCEACHGPASKHIELAKQLSTSETLTSDVNHSGFDRDLSKAVSEWVFTEGHKTLQPKEVVKTNQVQTCAQCHSRRTQLNESGDLVNGSFFDRYRLSFIAPELYYHDGQIFDEVYVYGSFLQSKMAASGVTCSDCHDPHRAELKAPEEELCSRCHIASEYSPEKHTFHEPDSEASRCTTCHMPETTYMQVDPRRDHSWHVPRPDLSQHIETPNVCRACHEDKTDEWANEKLKKWFPNSNYHNKQDFSVAFYADTIGHQGAAIALAYLAQDSSLNDIIRASALERMAGNTDQNTTLSLARAVKSDNEMIRLGAIAGSSGYEFHDRWRILQPLLNDPVLSVRAEAASALVTNYAQMTPAQRQRIKSPLEDYMEIQRFNADRGFGRTNLANVHRSLGNTDKAVELYQEAIAIEPYFENSYVNLADLYRSLGEEELAFAILQDGMKAQPKSIALPYSAGLSLLRQGDAEQAQILLKLAAETGRTNAHYWYVYGLSLESSDVLAASHALNTAYRVGGNPQHLYAKCEVLARNYAKGSVAVEFDRCTKQLSNYAPKQVVDQLKSSVTSP